MAWPATHMLKDQQVEITIDENGNLTSLRNLSTGHNYAGDQSLWRLYFDRNDGEKEIEIHGANTIMPYWAVGIKLQKHTGNGQALGSGMGQQVCSRDTGGFPKVQTRCFVNGSRMTIVLTQSTEKTATTSIRIPHFADQEHDAIGDVEVTAVAAGEQIVQPECNSLAVLIYKKHESLCVLQKGNQR